MEGENCRPLASLTLKPFFGHSLDNFFSIILPIKVVWSLRLEITIFFTIKFLLRTL